MRNIFFTIALLGFTTISQAKDINIEMPSTAESLRHHLTGQKEFLESYGALQECGSATIQKTGLSEQEQRRESNIRELGGIISQIIELEHPDIFGGSYITHDPYGMVFLFKGSDAEARMYLDAYTKEPEFSAKGVPYSYNELNSVLDVAVKTLHENGIELMGGADIETSTITIYVLDPERAAVILKDMLKDYDFLKLKKTTGFPKKLGYFKPGSLLIEEIPTPGPDQKFNLCTLGWGVVQHYTYEIGVSTAGHCLNNPEHTESETRLKVKAKKTSGLWICNGSNQQPEKSPCMYPVSFMMDIRQEL